MPNLSLKIYFFLFDQVFERRLHDVSSVRGGQIKAMVQFSIGLVAVLTRLRITFECLEARHEIGQVIGAFAIDAGRDFRKLTQLMRRKSHQRSNGRNHGCRSH